jgi:hypothetical protein
MDAAATRERDPPRRLAALGRAYVAFALANKAVFRLMFDGGARGHDNPRLNTARKAAYERLIAGIGSVIPESAQPARQAMADLAWASVHGFAVLVLGGELHGDGTSTAAFTERLDAVLRIVAGAVAR